MSADAIVRVRIKECLKKEASLVLVEMGFTISDVLHMLLTLIAREKALPFEPIMLSTLATGGVARVLSIHNKGAQKHGQPARKEGHHSAVSSKKTLHSG